MIWGNNGEKLGKIREKVFGDDYPVAAGAGRGARRSLVFGAVSGGALWRSHQSCPFQMKNVSFRCDVRHIRRTLSSCVLSLVKARRRPAQSQLYGLLMNFWGLLDPLEGGSFRAPVLGQF